MRKAMKQKRVRKKEGGQGKEVPTHLHWDRLSCNAPQPKSLKISLQSNKMHKLDLIYPTE
jgi:hypothetical protein